jgi:hypothetical protein
MSTAAAAKKALIEKSRAVKVDPTDPAFIERQAARQATAQARAERQGAAKLAKAQAAADRRAAKEAAEAFALSEQERRLAEAVLSAEQIQATEAERKAARDAKYAARKLRQK